MDEVVLKVKRRVSEKYRGQNCARWIPRETRSCACGCGLTFECKSNLQKRFISGHNSIGRECSEKTRNKIGTSNKGKTKGIIFSEERRQGLRGKQAKEKHHGWIQREERFCKCGCGTSFVCRQNSKRIYFKAAHSRKGEVSFSRPRTADEKQRISKAMKLKGYKDKTMQARFNWTNEQYEQYKIKSNIAKTGWHHTDDAKRRIGIGSRKTILKLYELGRFKFTDTKPHRFLRENMINENIWNDEWTNEFTFENALSIDMANESLKLAIFVDGDFWHANPIKYVANDIVRGKKTAENIWAKDKHVTTFVENHRWIVLRFWERDILRHIDVCIEKIKQVIYNIKNGLINKIDDKNSISNFDINTDYTQMQTLIIDANHLLSRTFHVPSFQSLKATVDGNTVLTGATYGFLNSLKSIVDTHPKDILIVVWDGGGKGFRSELYPQYKANRSARTDEFITQLTLTKQCLQLMGVRQAQIRGVEADDVIGILTRRARLKGYKVLIVSGDKDFNQLVSNNVNVLNPRAEEDNSDRLMTPEKVKEKYGILPNQFVDWLALNGDSTDNIEGIEGIGKKTATELILGNGGVKDIISTDVHYKMKDNEKKPVSKNLQEKINASKAILKLNRELVEIKTDLCDVVVDQTPPNFHELKNIFKKYEFNTFLKIFNEFVATFS